MGKRNESTRKKNRQGTLTAKRTEKITIRKRSSPSQPGKTRRGKQYGERTTKKKNDDGNELRGGKQVRPRNTIYKLSNKTTKKRKGGGGKSIIIKRQSDGHVGGNSVTKSPKKTKLGSP